MSFLDTIDFEEEPQALEVMEVELEEAPKREVPKWAFTEAPVQVGDWVYRYYQTLCIAAALNALRNGYWNILLVLCTGAGKTILFSYLAGLVVKYGGKVLILAHQDKLLNQAAKKLYTSTGLKCAKEKAKDRASLYDTVVMGSVQTLSKDARLHGFPPDHWALIITDETHRGLSPSYRKIYDYYTCPRLGFTATPDRGDKKCLSAIYEPIKGEDGKETLAAFEYGLIQGVRDGFLVRPIAETLPLEIDMNGVLTTAQVFARDKAKAAGASDEEIQRLVLIAGRNKNSDFDMGEVGHRIAPFIKQIAKVLAEKAKTRAQGMIFMPSVELARMMEAALIEAGMSAISVAGDDDDVDKRIERFESGEFQCLVNVMLLTEGYDHDRVDWVVCLRVTKIRSLLSQIVGRGTRPLNGIVKWLNDAQTAEERRAIIAKSGKPNLMIYDFLWLMADESMNIAKASEILARNDAVAQKIREEKLDGDLIEIEETANRDLLASLEKAAAKNKGRKGRTIDPLAMAVSVNAEDLKNYEPKEKWEFKAPSSQQIKRLTEARMDTSAVHTAGMASKIIGILDQRKNMGLCSVPQMDFLNKLGMEELHRLGIDNTALVTAEQAKKIVFQKTMQWRGKHLKHTAKVLSATNHPDLAF